MIHPKPSLFVKIAPVNPDGVTEIDLGEEMGQYVPVGQVAPLARHQSRYSSLPPSPMRAEYDHNIRAFRHGSLPPPSNRPKNPFFPPDEDVIKEMDDEVDGNDSDDLDDPDDPDDPESVCVTAPSPQNLKTLRVHAELANVSLP